MASPLAPVPVDLLEAHVTYRLPVEQFEGEVDEVVELVGQAKARDRQHELLEAHAALWPQRTNVHTHTASQSMLGQVMSGQLRSGTHILGGVHEREEEVVKGFYFELEIHSK
jgi:hypothetical protein